MSRAIRFTPAAWEDYTYWQGQDKKTLKRINTLIGAARRDPFAGYRQT
jgi:toxin YoeB